MHSYFKHIQLGYLGLLPFLFLVFWPLLLGSSSSAIETFTFYSLGILAFMAGTLWRAGEQSLTHALMSVICIIPFLSFAFLSFSYILIYLSICYPLVLVFEKKMSVWKEHHHDYKKMRHVLTSVVFVCHLFMIAQYYEIVTG